MVFSRYGCGNRPHQPGDVDSCRLSERQMYPNIPVFGNVSRALGRH